MKRKLQRIAIIAAALLFSTTAYSQNPLKYKNVYGTPDNELPVEHLSSSDGTYFCGKTYGRPSLTLVDPCGKVLFSRIYSYSNFTTFTSMTFAPNGDILMHATTNNQDWFVMRVDPGGNPIWGNYYDNKIERRASIIPSDNGNFFIVGWWSPGGSSDDVTVLKIDGGGAQIWAQRYDVTDDQVMDVISDQNGGLVATGGLHSSVDMFAVQIDQNGVVGPSMQYQQAGIHRFEARAVTRTQNGEYVFLGVSSMTPAWNPTVLTVLRTDPAFNPIWWRSFNTGNSINGVSHGVKEGINGHIYFTTKAVWGGLNDYSITELDPAGNLIQTRSIPDIARVNFNLNGAEQFHLNDRILLMGNTQTIVPFGMDDEILEMTNLNLDLCKSVHIDPEPIDVPLMNMPWNPTVAQMTFQITPYLVDPEEYLEFKQICKCATAFPVIEEMQIADKNTSSREFTIYPNITSGENIHLEYDIEEGENARLEVVDVSTGRQIEALSIELNEAGEMTIDLGGKGLEPGVYQFRVIYNNEVITRRLIVM